MKNNFLKNSTLLITGGTGSFGNEVLDHYLNQDLKEIRIFSRDEKKQDEMRLKYSNPKINFIVGDIRNYKSIENALYGVDYVFHAAALKQVPSCEFYPMQAIDTNILGSENLLEAAILNKVKKVVVLSTDKAVYPINTMGLSKAIMEKLTISKSRDLRVKYNGSKFCATRYGNVLSSRGSIVPLIIDQIKNKQNLTITNPEMTRFLMTLNQSVSLVSYAFSNANPGDIFIQKSPSATILDLVESLKLIFESKSKIIIIGSRHGEKQHETLCSKEEMSKAIDEDLYFRIPADLRDMNYSKYVSEKNEIIYKNDYSSNNSILLKNNDLISLLLSDNFVKNELKYK